MSQNILQEISKIGMIPVLNIDKLHRALPLADALQRGGLPLMEVMFRTDVAASCIKEIAKSRPDFLIGAGTILTEDQAKLAVDCGAKFLVAPGFNPKVVKCAQQLQVPIVPGCVSPTEVEAALDLGVKVLKFFPAVQNGGVPAMGLLAGPYRDITFVPTGDLDKKLAFEYLSFNKVAAAGGDFMLKYEDIHSDNYEKIEKDVAETIDLYFNFHVAHVGMNESSEDKAFDLASCLGKCLSKDVVKMQNSTFVGSLIEVMHKPFYHEKGHIAIGTRDATRAYHYLKRKGVEFIEDSVFLNDQGRVTAAYIKEDFAGFALHLMQD